MFNYLKNYFPVAKGLRVTSILLCIFCGLFIVGYRPAYAEEMTEYKIKAIYTYRFILFTEWPEKAPVSNVPDTVTIGIVGDDSFKNYFADVENRLIAQKGKKLTIKRLGPFREGLDIKKCRVLFVAGSERKNLKKILAVIEDDSILTVSDMDNFCEMGGIINLVSIDNRIRFEINLSRAKKIGLSMNSSLLQAAVRVIK